MTASNHERALSAALAECQAWDIPMQPAVMKKVIEAYLREMPLQKRCEELEAALEFYADELTWADTNPKNSDRITVIVPSPSFADIDKGRRAREALSIKEQG